MAGTTEDIVIMEVIAITHPVTTMLPVTTTRHVTTIITADGVSQRPQSEQRQ